MTGSVLPHKNLVTNYGLLSSIEDAAARASKPTGRTLDVPLQVIHVDESPSIGLSLAPSMETFETIAVTPATGEYAQVSPPPADNDDYEYS
jgi:hypothetical protein